VGRDTFMRTGTVYCTVQQHKDVFRMYSVPWTMDIYLDQWCSSPTPFPSTSCLSFSVFWAHRSYKLSDRSKAMSDPWFSERKEKSVERWVNCQKKEFADRSKRSLSSKERAIFGGSLLSDVRKNEWTKDTHYWKQDTWPISILFPSGVRIWAGGRGGPHLAPIKSQPPTLHL
jgi:hypothetical protein